MKAHETRPIGDLARDAEALVELARDRQEPIVITQGGEDAAVLVPIELYMKLESGRVYRIPSVRLANPEDAARFKMEMEIVEPDDGAELPE